MYYVEPKHRAYRKSYEGGGVVDLASCGECKLYPPRVVTEDVGLWWLLEGLLW